MKTIGIFPGQFQPPHTGHKKAYDKLKHYAGSDTFIATTDFDPSVEAPLHYGDKEQILVRHGIPASHIKRIKDLENPTEILENFDPKTTVLLYAFNKVEATRKLNESKYYQNFSFVGSHLLPFGKQAYIVIIDDTISIKDKEGKYKIITSKNVRESLGSHRFTKQQKQKWFKKFFGWFDLGLFELLQNKYAHAYQSDVFEPDEDELPSSEPDETDPDISTIKEMVKTELVNILNELMSSPPSIATDSSFGPDSIASDKENPADKETKQPTMADLTQDKKRAEQQRETNKKQFDRDDAAARNYKQNIKKMDDEKVKQAQLAISNFSKASQL